MNPCMMMNASTQKLENGSISDKKTTNCGCCSSTAHMYNSYSSGDFSVAVDSNDLTITREEYRYMSEDDDDCVYCTTSHPNVNLVLFLVVYVIFLVFGACLFTFLENPVQLQLREQLVRRQQAFLVQHPSVDEESLNALLEFVTSMQAKGVHWERLPVTKPSGPLTKTSQTHMSHVAPLVAVALDEPQPTPALRQALNATSTKAASTNWEFTSSLLFVTSIVTTIGYGHVTPLTHAGKVACMLYSGVGIPLTLTFLSTMVALLVRGPARVLETWLANFLMRVCRSASVFLIRLFHLMAVTTILLCICFFIPAYAFFCLEEGWTYLDALYYCYISLTTIGLGDFIPSMATHSTLTFYRVVTIVYLYFGLTMIMLWLALIYRIPQFNLNKLLIAEDKSRPPPSPGVSWDKREKQQSNEKVSILNNNLNSTPSTSPAISYGTQQSFISARFSQ